jgi:hypothetical protein
MKSLMRSGILSCDLFDAMQFRVLDGRLRAAHDVEEIVISRGTRD